MDALKAIVIVLDGLGDRPAAVLGNRTPLENAATPHLDQAAKRGINGLLHPLSGWLPVGTQVGMGLLLGLPPSDVHLLNRGPVEAAGAGISLQNGDVALRCNFATLAKEEPSFSIVNRRAGRIKEKREDLRDVLNGIDLGNGITSRFELTTGHRGVLVLSGPGLSHRISDTDPGAGYESKGVLWCTPLIPEAATTAQAINTFIARSHQILDAHPVNEERRANGLMPANGMLTRGAGYVSTLRNQLQHLGLQTALVTGERTALGLARLFGFTAIHKPSFTATSETDIAGKVTATLEATSNHDIVFLHIKAPDIFSHDGDPKGKSDFLEHIDKHLEPLLNSGHVVGITGDHSSDSTLQRHVGDPVPTTLLAPHSRKDNVEQLSESACITGALGQLSATAFITAILDHMNRLPNYSTQDYLFP